ncbi:MAG: hypothetical protein U9Q90_10780 [Campylobacterota bacterium]|nr:hypothetical protein [Campylobacterota bacterium]
MNQYNVLMKIVLFVCLAGALLQAHVDENVLYDFEKRCMTCHDTYNRNKIAPPLVSVNQMYLRIFDGNATAASERMKAFLSTPSKKLAVLQPAVKLFGVMPKQKLSSEDIENFVEVLLTTEFEIPDWVNEHIESHKREEKEARQK